MLGLTACDSSGKSRRLTLRQVLRRRQTRRRSCQLKGGEHVFAVKGVTFYDAAVGTARLADWIAALVGGEAPRVPES